MQREYGDLPPHSWVFAISELRDHQIERGIRKLINKGGASAPTLPQFVSACKWSDESDQEPTQSNVALPESPYNEPVWSHGQKCLLAFLWKSSKTYSDNQIKEMIVIKNKLVNDFKYVLAEDSSLTGAEIRNALFAAWGKV